MKKNILSFGVLVGVTIASIFFGEGVIVWHFFSIVPIFVFSLVGYRILTQDKESLVAKNAPFILFVINLILLMCAGVTSAKQEYEMGFMVVALSLAVSGVVSVIILFAQLSSVHKRIYQEEQESSHLDEVPRISTKKSIFLECFYPQQIRRMVGIWPFILQLFVLGVYQYLHTILSDEYFPVFIFLNPFIVSGIVGWRALRLHGQSVTISLYTVSVFALICSIIGAVASFVFPEVGENGEIREMSVIGIPFVLTFYFILSLLYGFIGLTLGKIGLFIDKK